MLWFFLIGALLPIPFYLLARRYPLSPWRFVNIPVLFAGISLLPPATGINFSSWFVVGAIFQWFMRRFHFRVSSFFTVQPTNLVTYLLDSGGCAITTFSAQLSTQELQLR